MTFCRRQGGSCADDLSQTTTQKFMTCSSEFQALENLDNISNADIQNFCTQKCGPYMVDLANKFAVDCGIPDALVCLY